MPKAKPTQVIVHRIELQETERATLEAALAGRFVTNAVSATGSVLTGIGSALAPFAGAFTAIAGLWLADKGIDQLLDAAKDAGEAQKKRNEEAYYDSGNRHMNNFNAWLIATYENGGWDAICDRDTVAQWYLEVTMPLSITKMPGWFVNICLRFLETICAQSSGMKSGQIPSELWADYYSIEQYGSDAYYHSTNGSTWGAIGETAANVLPSWIPGGKN